jgi:hypothetical protein
MLPLTHLKAASPIARRSPIVKNKPLKINGINILRRVRFSAPIAAACDA